MMITVSMQTNEKQLVWTGDARKWPPGIYRPVNDTFGIVIVSIPDVDGNVSAVLVGTDIDVADNLGYNYVRLAPGESVTLTQEK